MRTVTPCIRLAPVPKSCLAVLVLMMRMSSSVGRRAATISGLLSMLIPDEVMNFRSGNISGSSLTRKMVPLKMYILSMMVHPWKGLSARGTVSISNKDSPGTCAIIFVRGTLDVLQDSLVSEGRVGMP